MTISGALNRFARNRAAVAGASILIALLFMAVFADFIAPYDPNDQNLSDRLMPPGKKHLLGADHLGRDVLSRIIYGTRPTLMVSVLGIVIAAVSGVSMGLWAGFSGGVVDTVVMRLVDIILAFPMMLLAIAITAGLGPGLTNVSIAIGIVSFPVYARLVRGQALFLKETDFVMAARVAGATPVRIMRRHILPNCVVPIVVQLGLSVAVAILMISALSFLGLGAQPPTPEWGAMLADGREFIYTFYHLATFPGIAIALTVLGFNLFTDGLREILDPLALAQRR